MSALFIIAAVIAVVAILATLFTDIHPNVFYPVMLFAIALSSVPDVWLGHWGWYLTWTSAWAVVTAVAWRKDAQDDRKRAAA